MKKTIAQALLKLGISMLFPGCRMDWVSPNEAVITNPEGRRQMMKCKCKRRRWIWTSLTTWLVPAVIWLWGLWMLFTVIAMTILL